MDDIKVNKIKVLRVVSRLNIGGASIHIKTLTMGMDRQKFDTKVIIGQISKHEGDMSYLLNQSNGLVQRMPNLQREIHPVKDILAWFKILKKIITIDPDILDTHMAKAGTIARSAAVIYNLLFHKNVKLVHTFHGHVLEGYFSRGKSNVFLLIERTIGKSTDAIIAISKTQKWELSEMLRISHANKIHVINLGFNLEPFVSSNLKNGKLREKIGVDDKSILIGIVGRLVPIKNHNMFLRVAKMLIETNCDQQFKFLIVGDGELRHDLELYAKTIGIQGHVIFWGWERDVSMIYADLDILALTSQNEGTPVSIIEAMASRVPVITTGVGGVKDLLGKIVEENPNADGFKVCERGILCQKNDPIGFGNGIWYLINNGLYKNTQYLVSSQEFVIRNYSDRTLVRKTSDLYQQLVCKN